MTDTDSPPAPAPEPAPHPAKPHKVSHHTLTVIGLVTGVVLGLILNYFATDPAKGELLPQAAAVVAIAKTIGSLFL
ncbi:MAG TPA: hypothetical protein VL132_06245, partial [Planctomycetaceae bacterium]|nr:hypothetical protein [Planctomycetaceae bacterium]